MRVRPTLLWPADTTHTLTHSRALTHTPPVASRIFPVMKVFGCRYETFLMSVQLVWRLQRRRTVFRASQHVFQHLRGSWTPYAHPPRQLLLSRFHVHNLSSTTHFRHSEHGGQACHRAAKHHTGSGTAFHTILVESKTKKFSAAAHRVSIIHRGLLVLTYASAHASPSAVAAF